MYLSEDAAEFPGQTLIEWTHAPMRVGRTHAFEEADHQDGMLRIEIRASRHQCLERCQWAVILGRIVAIRFTRETCYHFGRVVLYLLDEPNRAAIDFYGQIVIAPRKIPDLNPLTAVQFRETTVAQIACNRVRIQERERHEQAPNLPCDEIIAY